jgi:hypothetical protein
MAGQNLSKLSKLSGQENIFSVNQRGPLSETIVICVTRVTRVTRVTESSLDRLHDCIDPWWTGQKNIFC